MPTVLIADDSPTIRGFARLALRGLPEVLLLDAEDGVQALALLRQHPVALALIDVNMPNLDGLGVLRALRQDPEPLLRALPVLLLTAERSEQLRADCLAAGAKGFTGFLDKPLRLADLKARVEELLADHAGGPR